ncbi:MAG TPA: ABC transporter permease [Stellaceae bacterium]|nr:ABC transporter permease [Stellaceae bacterium]
MAEQAGSVASLAFPGSRSGETPLARALTTPQGRIGARILLVAILLLAWEFAPVGKGTGFWLSKPSLVAGTIWQWILDGTLRVHLQATLAVMAEGYVTGCLAGIGIGIVLGLVPRLHRVVSPFLAGFYAMPKIALAPLFIILLGVGDLSKVALVAITVFFLVVTNTIEGVRDVDRDLVRSLTLMGATRVEVIRKVVVRSALPWIFTGMRIAVRYAFTNTLLAELIAANRGLGFLIEFNSGNFNITGAYAGIAVLVLCSVLLTELLSRLEARVSRWRG